jgi:hypothetical protein
VRARTLFVLALGMLTTAAIHAQDGALVVPVNPLGPAGASPRLAQFQPGISPLGSNLDLSPGQAVRLALYCADLFADTPSERVAFTAPGGEARVMLASGLDLPLGEALEAGMLRARGRGPGDPPHPAGGEWFDAFLTNATDQPLHVSLPAGTLLVPAGQPIPEVRTTVRRLFAAARERGLLGSETLAHAVWATRGFTREDVEQTTMAHLSDAAARQVQELLAAADLGYDFSRGSGDYAKLFEQRRAAIAEKATPITGSALLPQGKSARVELLPDAGGQALVALTPANGGTPLYYAGRVTSRRPDRMELELRHLKTGRPLEVARGALRVRLTVQEAHR